MRVLLQGRSARSVATTPGGDQVQIEQTAEALRIDYGIDAIASSELAPDLTGVDVVHLFGLVRPQEVWTQARNARRQGVPVVLSTVYCDVWEFEREARAGALGTIARHSNRNVLEALKAGGRGVLAREWSSGSARLFTRGFAAMQREILTWSSAFLPNSVSEWHRVRDDFSFFDADDRVFVVPNGVDLSDIAEHGADEPAAELRQYDGCVLCVARLEGRKNQLALIEAVRGTDMTLVLAGKPSANQPAYISALKRAAADADNVHIVGAVDHQTKHGLYRMARVHALPSWIETTGLSSLEAAMFDCSLVVSPNGDTREYFGNEAEYCDPANPSDIRAALHRAYDRPGSSVLKDRIETSYTWKAAAEATMCAYEYVRARSAR